MVKSNTQIFFSLFSSLNSTLKWTITGTEHKNLLSKSPIFSPYFGINISLKERKGHFFIGLYGLICQSSVSVAIFYLTFIRIYTNKIVFIENSSKWVNSFFVNFNLLHRLITISIQIQKNPKWQSIFVFYQN